MFLINFKPTNKDYEKEIKRYIDELERDKERIMEKRGLKLEVEKVSNAYRKRLPKRSRKTFCQ